MKQIVEFCTYCGKKLEEREPITADHFGIGFYYPHAFDPKTGKTRMSKWIACPGYNENKFRGEGWRHDAHAIGEEYLV